MKYYIIILISILTLSCQTKQNNTENSKIDLLFESNFEHSLISRGNNFPDFQYKKDSMDFFLISLHQNIPISDFKKRAKLTDNQINKIKKLLETKNWLHYTNGKPKPSVFIATQKDGEKLFKSSIPIANKVVGEIQKELPDIKLKFNETEISKTQDFEKWSFLILSNVLLDSWQIDNVEKYYLNKEKRPNRHGKNYYYSIMENTDKNRETFGIYGNQYEEINGKSISIYGNNRLNISLKQSENEISKSDNEIFSKIASDFKPKLIDILNSEDNYIRKTYKETGYQKEITFEEFFIWWYHFMYTMATKIMSDNNMLKIPDSGNFEYQIEE
ncbi:hypothetical protein [Flammeovirga kamogawensis]|uniref:Uncharacterized protein n=3 Tax=Flammeovirga kamogawensis TaxID=373891 RepID=A0ABX8H4D4_9BACT|nr:hypothetical protein [Flammeovirga kamogawensis]MBB6463840.1 hypothetical protein [Flammeovirga kamogawensis]QWG10765.1 hypothetical protein KM029_26765 [Flammeovirga kamogawensis]